MLLYTPKSDNISKETVQLAQSEIHDLHMGKTRPTFKATIKVNKMDPLQKEYSPLGENSYNRDITMSYLKVLNVPTISDIDYYSSEPDKNHLVLDYVDNISHEIQQQELDYEKDRVKFKNTEKLYEALKSIHVHLNVSEINIYFGGNLSCNHV
jgi:hypothetical protein